MGIAFYGGRQVIYAALAEPAAPPAYRMISTLSRARDQFSDHWRSWQLSGHEQGA
jgi:hypothetical protein